MKKVLPILSGIFLISLVSAQTNIMGTAKGLFGDFTFGAIWDILSYGILAIVVLGVVAFFVQQHLMKKKFNKTITFFKKNPLTGLGVADKSIKAMTVRLDNFGNLGYRLQTPYETVNLMPKLKIEAKPNHHYVEYCEDGRIVEIGGIKGYDEHRKAYNITFSDSNTELGRSSMHQMNKARYEKTSFWKEHATLFVNIGAIVIIMVFLWLIADKLIDVVNSIGSLLKESGKLQESQSNIIDSLNRLLTQHSIK
jgi:hypothetical protein